MLDGEQANPGCPGCRVLQKQVAALEAKVQLGGRTHALIAWLNKRLSLSHGKVKELLQRVFALTIGRATSCRSMPGPWE